jgi:2-keto-4-pentenoate hydratase/2-oxohepta-3-ene-1,7-dioic acid hydratase in catechol pathway
MIEYIELTNGEKTIPGTCFCVGQNYAKHAAEMGSNVSKDPVIFFKPSQALVASGSSIVLPSYSQNVHHEVELCVMIGKNAVDVEEVQANDYIAGYGIGIDLTLRDLQQQAKEKGKPWGTAKGFRDSAPISQFIPVDELEGNIFDLELKINNETRQKGSTSEMSRTVEQLVSYLSKIFTLKKGDVIFTGTPDGVGQVKVGDIAEAYLDGKKMLTTNF